MPYPPGIPPIILASASPRRRELLAAFGLPFRIITSNIPEELPPDLDIETGVRWLARLKAEAVAETLAEGLVIGADTVVVVDGLALGKPRDMADSCRMLRLLRGRPHLLVISGVAVFDAAARRSGATSAVTTTVHMRDYSDQEIETYALSGEPLDKAGSYAIQGLGGALVERIEGCYNNVVGFPLCEVAALLEGFAITPAAEGPICALPGGEPCPRLPR